MMDLLVSVTIVLMAIATYLTRVLGFLLLRNRTVSPTMQSVMEAAPGCVLIAVIAPKFASGQPTDLAALAIPLLAATRFSILPVVLIAIIVTGTLRQLWPA
ncbi:AzlD family protein [Stutzerimonas nitrititolerans]|uniref:AzlD family protein n=1 Tax=Stutzerimonas nitrititolerans TaxID=2482751 RepID=UPI000F7679CE|nr:AzlD family protein [Stutzerimonas nitrititolerans]RRV19886.1 AzlD family protein [Pseudomonas sp. s199]